MTTRKRKTKAGNKVKQRPIAVAQPAPKASPPTDKTVEKQPPALAAANPNAILPAKLTPGGPPISSYPAMVPAPDQLLIASDGRSHAELKAESALNPVVLNAITAMNATRPSMAKGDLASVGITAYVKVMAAKIAAVEAGDMSGVEATMTAQIISMDALFSELALKAGTNMAAGYLEVGETYMRLAFKAQAQCRATAETLGELKNPRPVFAKQFNLANGNQQINQSEGPQQVNNRSSEQSARAGKNENPTNKLLEQA